MKAVILSSFPGSKIRREMGQKTPAPPGFLGEAYAIFSNLSGGAPQTGHLSLIGPLWV